MRVATLLLLPLFAVTGAPAQEDVLAVERRGDVRAHAAAVKLLRKTRMPLVVEDLTATEGEDYFAPGSYSISFGPGQRTARLLVPLVQDTRAEGNDAFVLKLAVDHESRPASVSPNIAVMIRDDER